MLAESERADIVIMAAAVADFRPKAAAAQKLKRREGIPEIVLEPTPDILALLAARRREGQVLVGFAAETEDAVGNGARKLADKGVDLVVVNDVSRADVGFGSEDNEVTILSAAGAREVGRAPKRAIAAAVLDACRERLDAQTGVSSAATAPPFPSGEAPHPNLATPARSEPARDRRGPARREPRIDRGLSHLVPSGLRAGRIRAGRHRVGRAPRRAAPGWRVTGGLVEAWRRGRSSACRCRAAMSTGGCSVPGSGGALTGVLREVPSGCSRSVPRPSSSTSPASPAWRFAGRLRPFLLLGSPPRR